MAVADVYDALMENRVYRNSLSHIQASNIIFDNAGTHFDPRIVETFRKTEAQITEIVNAH